jgi:triphosphatase
MAAQAQSATARARKQAARPPEPAAAVTPEEPARETELRLVADAATFKALASHSLLGAKAPLKWTQQRTVYFDTDAADLQRSGITLRLRSVRGRKLLSLKLREGSFDCEKIEVRAPGEGPQIELLPPASQELIGAAAQARSLAPRFASQIRRATRLVAYEGATIEVAFDEGEIVAGAQKAVVREIELELKSGPPASLYRFALALVEAAPLRMGVSSKADRGARLLSRRPPQAMRAPPPEIEPDASLDAATAAMLRQCLTHFLGNWDALSSDNADDCVHQTRVSMRRLRSLLLLLGRSFPSGEISGLRAEARRIADAFGAARDWRVFADLVEDGPAKHLSAPGLPTLIAEARKRAAQGRAAALAAQADVETTRFVLALQLYIATRGWRNALAEADVQELGQPAIAFAARALAATFGKVRKRGRGFETLAAEARHELRIALKGLRYAVDFLGPLFRPASAVREYAEKASALQEMLGAANDTAMAASLLAQIDTTRQPDLAFASGLVLGWCGRASLADEGALRRAWRKVKKSEPFWQAVEAPGLQVH